MCGCPRPYTPPWTHTLGTSTTFVMLLCHFEAMTSQTSTRKSIPKTTIMALHWLRVFGQTATFYAHALAGPWYALHHVWVRLPPWQPRRASRCMQPFSPLEHLGDLWAISIE